MKKNFTGKILFIVAILLVFTAGMFLGPYSKWAGSWQALKERGPVAALSHSINLGLDLRGGTHLILQVMVDDAVKAEANRAASSLQEALRGANVVFSDVSQDPNNPSRVSIKGVSNDQVGTLRQTISERFGEYDLTSAADGGWQIAMKPQALDQLKKDAVTQAIETIRQRVDSLGVTEPIIQEHGLGEHQILVQLPGVDDPARVKDIIQSTAMLEVRHVLGGPFSTEQEAQQNISFGQNGMVMAEQKGTSIGPYWIVKRNAEVAGRDVRSARVDPDENGNPQVTFFLTADAGRKFESFTGGHIGEKLGVVLDNRLREVATIQSAIEDTGRITGAFTQQQAADLSMTLKSGSLPASIQYREERTVGPSLGIDSIRQGVRAGIIGLLAVVIFMLVYYKGAGINANLALFLNVILLLGFMGFSGATLTLPGIAGVILTVGMAVDSNVLIFERIKEELRAGKAVPAAVDQGFGRAWLTIIDTHVTTIVSALILFLFGTGPVRGFAVTLSFGLLANVFTAVFVSRVIFDWLLTRKQRGEALSI